MLTACLRDAATVSDAVAGFVARRSPRTGWVRAQTHRRDRTRNLPSVLRNLILRVLGRQIFRSTTSRCWSPSSSATIAARPGSRDREVLASGGSSTTWFRLPRY